MTQISPAVGAGIGIPSVVLGAMSIGFAIKASNLSAEKPMRLSLGPQVIPDVRGNPAYGLGVKLAGF